MRGVHLILAADSFTSELKSLGGEKYLIWSPPLAGAVIAFQKSRSDEPSFILDPADPDISEKYTFQRTRSPDAKPTARDRRKP